MKSSYYRLHAITGVWHYIGREALVALCFLLLLIASPVSAADMRFQERSLYMSSTIPGEAASYTISFRYMSPEPVGSVDMLFCTDPIPYHPCIPPPGLDVSNASLVEQDGETGFTVGSQSDHHIVLSRSPQAITATAPSSYKFTNIVNPSDTNQAFAIRLRSHASLDGTGSQIDFGSIRGQVTESIIIQTQVPPMLIFCVAEEVDDSCAGTNQNFYRDMGSLSDQTTLTAQSQMAVGTNASGGFAITASGAPMSAGTNVIDSPDTPEPSRPGTNQFAINLVENDQPAVGANPSGAWTNAVVSPDYAQPNRYKYTSGDVVAYSPNVSLMRKFTVSYILNSHRDLKPGVYSTTVNYIASGRF